MATALLTGQGLAPQKSVLENTGQPMRVEYACTEDDILHFGLTCSAQEPCAVYLELTSIETVGNKLFVAGNLHTSTLTLASILLASEDAGRTWYEPHERIRAAGLEQIQFVDFEYGWIGGQVLAGFPRDPFLLITNDGGKTWRRRPVFSETRVGAMEQFWFGSRANGTLWIDRTQSGEAGLRHELYETMNGGDSWMLRRASDQPIRSTRVPEHLGNLDWRFRPDAATHSYGLEKRQGDRWARVASFLIPAGECRPKEQPLAEPAPPEPATPAQPPETPGPRKPPTLKKKPR